MTSDVTFELSERNDGDVKDAIIAGLEEYNDSRCEVSNYKPFQVVLRDDTGVIKGACMGATLFRWMDVDFVWVDKSCRGKDLGLKLLAEAEKHARALGCVGMQLKTFSFQARGFYEKAGFTCWATMEGYPPGHATHYMRKDF